MSRDLSRFYLRIFPWIVFVHTLLFVTFWLTNSLFYASSNDYLAGILGRRMDYVSLLIWISAFIAAWSGVRGILGYLRNTHKLYILSSWLYGVVSVIYILFFYGSFWLLFRESPVQIVRLGQLLGYYRLILDSLLLLGFALLAGLLFRSFLRKSPARGKRVSWLPWVGLMIIYLIFWILGLVYPPTSLVQHGLPEKPLLIAHRGASMLAPENTLASAQLAASLDVYGLETDVHVSRDGQLFLMHDDTFDRTTDVRVKFPGREEEPVENFTLAEIRQLNAGKWFVQQDPYHAIRQGLVSAEQVGEYEQQAVPLLADWLEIVKQHHLAFRFDIKQPPAGNPYSSSFFELTLNQVHQAQIDSQVWMLVNQPQLHLMSGVAPAMIPTFSADYQSLPPTTNLVSEGYKIVNVEYGISPYWIRQYQQAGLWVDVYTVDEPWQFSRLWLLGVDSVTTSNSGVMTNLEHPIFSQTWSQYLLVWGLVGLAGLGWMVWMISQALKKE